jgi:hypothetical protein
MVVEATSTDEVAAKLNALPLVRAGLPQPAMNVFTRPGSTAAVAAIYPLSPVSVIQQNYLTIPQEYCMLQKRKSGLPPGLV